MYCNKDILFLLKDLCFPQVVKLCFNIQIFYWACLNFSQKLVIHLWFIGLYFFDVIKEMLVLDYAFLQEKCI